MGSPFFTAEIPLREELLDVRALIDAWGVDRSSFLATWEQRHALNMPGPVYVGEDDACGCGPVAAPNNVLIFDGPYYGEFVFRQPSTPFELRQIIEAAIVNPMGAYALDGDSHWTPDLVTEWWDRMRAVRNDLIGILLGQATRVRAFIDKLPRGATNESHADELRELSAGRPEEGLHRWADYLEHGAEAYLKRYCDQLRASAPNRV